MLTAEALMIQPGGTVILTEPSLGVEAVGLTEGRIKGRTEGIIKGITEGITGGRIEGIAEGITAGGTGGTVTFGLTFTK